MATLEMAHAHELKFAGEKESFSGRGGGAARGV